MTPSKRPSHSSGHEARSGGTLLHAQRLKTLILLIILPLWTLLTLPTRVNSQVGDYTPKGQMITVDPFQVYVYGTGKLPVIAFHDIFGVKPKMQKMMDEIVDGSGGTIKMILPDFCQQKDVPRPTDSPDSPDLSEPADAPEHPDSRQLERCTAIGWGTLKHYLRVILTHFKESESTTRFGVIGFCYGAYSVIYASRDFTENVVVTAVIHPYHYPGVDEETLREYAADVKSPMLIMPSREEPDMTPFYEVVKAKFGEDRTKHYRFSNLKHGFAANLADLSNPEEIKGRQMVVQLLTEFFYRIYYNRSLPTTATEVNTKSTVSSNGGNPTSMRIPGSSGADFGRIAGSVLGFLFIFRASGAF